VKLLIKGHARSQKPQAPLRRYGKSHVLKKGTELKVGFYLKESSEIGEPPQNKQSPSCWDEKPWDPAKRANKTFECNQKRPVKNVIEKQVGRTEGQDKGKNHQKKRIGINWEPTVLPTGHPVSSSKRTRKVKIQRSQKKK